MTCSDHQSAILDLARGVPLPSAMLAGAEAHLATCPGCTARLRQQRELTAGLHALARSFDEAAPRPSLEAALLRQFESGVGGRSRPARGFSRVAPPLALAAGVAMAIWLGVLARRSPAPGGPPALARWSPPLLTAADKLDPRAIGLPTAVPAVPARAPVRRATAAAAGVRTIEFTPVPGASALPAFESGHIVRMALPVAALPAYGVEIVPEAARQDVTADLLVGQDGLPRGIRLVGRE